MTLCTALCLARLTAELGRRRQLFLTTLCVQDVLLPLAISCLHKPSHIHLCQALLGGSVHNFSLVCVPVPSEFKTYEQLYATMCKQNQQIPLALYRAAPDELDEYIYTNPLPSTDLRKGDLVYCSQSHEPQEAGDFGRVRKGDLVPQKKHSAPPIEKGDPNTSPVVVHFVNPISSKSPPPEDTDHDLHTPEDGPKLKMHGESFNVEM